MCSKYLISRMFYGEVLGLVLYCPILFLKNCVLNRRKKRKKKLIFSTESWLIYA